jgi:hypothetical protein
VIFAVAVIPAVDGIFAVASFPADPGVPMLLLLVSLHTVLYNEPSDFQTKAIGLSFFLLSNYQTIKYGTGVFEKLSDFRISDQGHNLSDYRILDSQKTMGCPPLILRSRKK